MLQYYSIDEFHPALGNKSKKQTFAVNRIWQQGNSGISYKTKCLLMLIQHWVTETQPPNKERPLESEKQSYTSKMKRS